MEAAEETLTYRDDTGLHRKLLPEDKEKDGKERAETHSDESNYVDLDMKPDGAKTVKVTFTGDGNQLSVIKSDSAKQGERAEDTRAVSPVEAPPALPNGSALDADAAAEAQRPAPAEPDPSDCSDELQYTDMYLHSRTESDDGTSAVLSDHCGSDIVEDESHYITTHEIQLTELDHDVDYDLGRGTCWDFEDDNLVYSFVDYASFESDDTQEGTLIVEGRSQATVRANLGPEPDESDLCDSDKCASSDESLCKHLGGDANVGEIHLSIKTASRAVNEPVDSFDSSTCEYTKNFGDRSHFSFVSSGARAGPLCDRAQYFIPAPGRQHLATKLRRKDINEYSSGASSSISELDDADKEVRNLTAKSFRSLACPYFDAINLSTSSESSMSEYGLNKWSAYVDWNYGKISRGRERSVIAHKTSSATVEMNKTVEGKRHAKAISGTKAQQIKMSTVNKRTASQHAPSSSQKSESRDPAHPKPRGVTLNFRCVEAPAGARRPKGSKTPRSGEVMGTVLTRSGCEMQYHHVDGMGDSHKRAIFASSLLKNVISKKMQFEQERKMERGEIRDTYPALSPCFQLKDPDRCAGRGFHRQNSESGSAYTVNSADDQPFEGSRPSSCEPEEHRGNKETDEPEKEQHSKESSECPKAQLGQSQSSAFNSWKEDESGKEAELPAIDAQTTKETAAKELDTNSMLTKLLFVPSCQRFSKEKECTDVSTHAPVTGSPAGPQKCEKVFKTGNGGNIVDKAEKGEKTPEIKICLRSVKENKGCTLNIANLLTPKISSNTVNTFRAAGEAKCHVLSASDKIPNFTVRDIRDTKCKFQTPIYHVRDVRKLVKSSYRFVSLDNSEGKASGAPLAPGDKPEERVKKEQEKQLLPSPMVIKCQSVKTNGKSQIKEASHKQTDVDVVVEASPSENTPCTAARGPPLSVKQVNPDQSEAQTAAEKLRQRLEKFPGEPKIPKQAALEKLKAAVKTMEQLYVFDRNEWKRKAQAPQPITDSHVLSLIASEEQGAEEPTDGDSVPSNQGERGKAQHEPAAAAAGSLSIIHVPYNHDTFKTQSQQSKTFSNQSVLHLGKSGNARVSISSVASPQSSTVQTSSSLKSAKTPVPPLSVKIGPPKHAQAEQRNVKASPTQPHPAAQDSENYLTIPGLGFTNEIKVLSQEPVAKEASATVNHAEKQKRSPLIMEYPSSSIYHQPAAGAQAQQVLRFSPSAAAAISPTSSVGDMAPQTQRKMLLDPTTGHYYLVDTPIQPTTKRLFDPETGQYVDVPMPGSPVAHPATPVTPVPLSLSPLALASAAYAPTYMIYPGFIPSPTLSAQALLPQSPCHSEEDKSAKSPKQEAAGAESTYFTATRETPQGPPVLPSGAGLTSARGSATGSDRKPIISITTQQGPRIIAPPSFDGTTMSFVVEHR